MVWLVTAVDPPGEPEFVPVSTNTSNAGKNNKIFN
jgi:hypothetical protein